MTTTQEIWQTKIQELEQARNSLERRIDQATSLDQRMTLLTLVNLEILKAIENQVEFQPTLPKGIPPYTVRTYPLDTVRTDEKVQIPGNAILAYSDGELSGCSVKLDSQVNDSITLSEFNGTYLDAGFSEFYLTTIAQSGKYLKLIIIRGKPGNIMAEMAVNVTAQVVEQITVDIAAQSIGNISIDIAAQALENLNVNIAAQAANIDINIAAQDANINVNLAASAATVNVDITAQTLGNIGVDIAAQSIDNLNVDIVAQAVGNLTVDIAAQTIGNIDVNIAASVATLNFNIVASSVVLNMKIQSQAAGVKSLTDWATQEAEDFHTQGTVAALADAGNSTLITLTLVTTKEHWLYTVHISGTGSGIGQVRANKTGGYDELAYGYFSANNGFIKDWLAPVKRGKDAGAGITEITVVVTNNSGGAADYSATLDGLTVIDITVDEETYDSEAEFAACATKVQIDTGTSSGDVILDTET